MRGLFLIALVVRLSSVFVIQTSYVPDETWQCAEYRPLPGRYCDRICTAKVAHKLVFGRGHLTWEWKEGLRSYLHPLLFAAPLMVLKLLSIDTAWLVILLPRLMQAVLCFVGDVLLYRLVVKLYGHTQASYTIMMQLSSWYLYYVSPRPLIHNMETLLITATLNLWPTRYSDVVSYPAVIVAAISVAIRPTLVLFWVFLGIHYLISCPEKRYSSVVKSTVIGIPTFLAMFMLDSYMYERPVCVFFNFIKFNLVSSDVYGSHPWHWYLSQGIPVILGTHAIFIILAFVQHRDYPRQFMGVVVVTVLFLSVIPHKEFRFIQHLMPVFMLWAGLGAHWLGRHLDRSSLFAILMSHSLLNAIVAFYIGFFHQRGTISVIQDLSQAVTPGDHVVFLTPCHSTPLHSHIHTENVTLRFLDCSPGLSYDHEEKQFYQDPLSWWEDYNSSRQESGNEYIVVFEESLPEIHGVLKRNGYSTGKRYFFAHLLVDDKLSPHLLLYKKTF